MIGLIALDLDGTLLTPAKRISATSREALRRAAARGIPTTLCSGRMAYSVGQYARELGLAAPAVALNGAHVFEPVTGRTLAEQPLGGALTRRCVEVAEALDLHYCAFCAHTVYSRFVFTGLEKYAQMARRPRGPLPLALRLVPSGTALLAAVGEGALDVMLSGSPERIQAARKLLAPESLTITGFGGANLELVARGVDKGSGLALVAERLDASPRCILALGDDENDAAMFRYAGFPVAMGNAAPGALAAARYRTAANTRAGVARAIERFCLEGEG